MEYLEKKKQVNSNEEWIGSTFVWSLLVFACFQLHARVSGSVEIIVIVFSSTAAAAAAAADTAAVAFS